MSKIEKWLEETHGPGFELLRHFLATFFHSDLITAPGQMTPALIGAFSVFLPWFPLIVAPLRGKYAFLSALPSPIPYRRAIEADELWLITLMMSAIAFLTAIKWQSIFPGLRDYRSLASLPLRPYKVFSAKLLALLLVGTAAILVLNFLPSVLFPIVSGSHWAINPSFTRRVLVHATASILGCYFSFFALVALQGLLLTGLHPRVFNRISGFLQGLVVPVMLGFIILSFSIQPKVLSRVLQPDLARWLPPVWFLGLYQRMLGDPDPVMGALAGRAITGVFVSMLLTLGTYVLSYHRHRVSVLVGVPTPSRIRNWLFDILDRSIPQAREQAVIGFIARTLSASSQHRMIFMAYIGSGLAILLSGLLGMHNVVRSTELTAASFIYAHIILCMFLLIGLRHLFSIPVELKANWIFQITEEEGRRQWLNAVDRFVLFLAAGLLLAPFPIEFKLLGWRAINESILIAAFGLLCFELIFYSWEKLPFTCSHLPGKVPMWIRALQLFAILGLLPAVNAILLACLYNRFLFAAALLVLIGVWVPTQLLRKENQGSLRLKYDELPEPAVHSLNLLK